jgi:regulator of protease activity HflC (stomatin/prohibitin superfamily)
VLTARRLGNAQAQFDAGELITQRELVSQRIRQGLIKRSAEFDIDLEDISITHLTFGKEFAQAVEMKQVGMLSWLRTSSRGARATHVLPLYV